jgi:hypothetical protein
VAHNKLTKTTIARQFCCSGSSMIGTMRRIKKTAIVMRSTQNVLLSKNFGQE